MRSTHGVFQQMIGCKSVWVTSCTAFKNTDLRNSIDRTCDEELHSQKSVNYKRYSLQLNFFNTDVNGRNLLIDVPVPGASLQAGPSLPKEKSSPRNVCGRG